MRALVYECYDNKGNKVKEVTTYAAAVEWKNTQPGNYYKDSMREIKKL